MKASAEKEIFFFKNQIEMLGLKSKIAEIKSSVEWAQRKESVSYKIGQLKWTDGEKIE